MPKDIGGLYAQALKGSLKNLPNQVKEGLLKQNFDRALQGSSPIVPLMETVPAPTIIKSTIPAPVDPVDVPVEVDVPVIEPEITPPPPKAVTVKPAVKSVQSGSIV